MNYDKQIILINKNISKNKDKIINFYKNSYRCAICCELDLISNASKYKCINNHLIHDNCLYNWLIKSDTCPICRVDMNYKLNLLNNISQYKIEELDKILKMKINNLNYNNNLINDFKKAIYYCNIIKLGYEDIENNNKNNHIKPYDILISYNYLFIYFPNILNRII